MCWTLQSKWNSYFAHIKAYQFFSQREALYEAEKKWYAEDGIQCFTHWNSWENIYFCQASCERCTYLDVDVWLSYIDTSCFILLSCAFIEKYFRQNAHICCCMGTHCVHPNGQKLSNIVKTYSDTFVSQSLDVDLSWEH